MFKPALTEIPPYRVATPAHRIKLNQNENPYELPARIKRRILSRMRQADWSRYPPFPARELQRRLARIHRTSARCVLVGNGSNELLLSAALATLRRGSRVVLPTPSFPVFERVSRICEARIRSVPLGPDLEYPVETLCREASRPATSLVFLASPNNPTGTVLRPADVLRIARSTRALVVLDEAYRQFASRDHRLLLDRAPNVVIVRTFSKAFGLAGLRLGYALARSEVATALEAATLPFSVDRFAQIAAEELLGHPGIVRETVGRIVRERVRLTRRLGRMPGIHVFPSEANFVLVRVRGAGRVWKRLLQRGILVRDVSGHPYLRDCLRITVGRPQQNSTLLRALGEILPPGKPASANPRSRPSRRRQARPS